MKNLLSVENLVSTTAKEARLFDLEFSVGGKRVFIKGAKLYGNSGMPFDDYLNYWNDEANLKRAIDEAKRIETVETKLFNEKPGDFKMKNLLNWNNFVAVSENSNGSYNLEFHVDGLLIVITGAELTESVTVDGVPQHPLKYWHQEENIKRAIEWAEPEDIEVIGELDELDAEEDIKSILAAKDFEGILDEIADITADLENNSTDVAKRLDKVTLELQKQGKTANKDATSVSEPKSEVALTAKQLADMADELLMFSRVLKLQNHSINLTRSTQEVHGDELILHYDALYKFTEDVYITNVDMAKKIDEISFLLQESENKDEISAFYNK